MPENNSVKVVYSGLLANVAIAICKFVAAGLTGSSAMLAEAFHSAADAGNEFLLWIGIRRSMRPPDALHPYGHGKALYFYSLLVAVYIFGIGGGLAVHEGISHLHHPQLSTHAGWNYLVLALSAGFDFYSWQVSYRVLRSQKDPNESLWDEIIGGKDPTIFNCLPRRLGGLAGSCAGICRDLSRPTFQESVLRSNCVDSHRLGAGSDGGFLGTGERGVTDWGEDKPGTDTTRE